MIALVAARKLIRRSRHGGAGGTDGSLIAFLVYEIVESYASRSV